MTVSNNANDFTYKVGDVDIVAVRLTQTIPLVDGSTAIVPIDLSGGAVVVFNMVLKTGGGSKQTLTCTSGATLNGITKLATDGWCTMSVTSAATTTATTYKGEFVVTVNGLVAHVPFGNDYYLFQVNASI